MFKLKEAYFAGGCFWCMEAAFEELKGVKESISGYSGGDQPNPTYEQVSAHETDHLEAVKVIYDPKIIPYKQLIVKFEIVFASRLMSSIFLIDPKNRDP